MFRYRLVSAASRPGVWRMTMEYVQAGHASDKADVNSKIRTIEMDGKRVKLQIVRAPGS